MKTFALAAMAMLLCSATQNPQNPTPGPGSKCTNQGARIQGGGSSTSNPTSTCSDGDPCGYVLTYNTPRTTCSPLTGYCCLPQVQQSYTQRFGCVDDGQNNNPITTVCEGGVKDYFGPPVIVDVTVQCGEDKKCGHLPEDY